MNNWSENYQSPAYLKATRQAYLNRDFSKIVLRYSNIYNGCRVLDVGCGVGCFSQYLSEHVNGVSFTGVDSDEYMIANGVSVHEGNDISYVLGDAYELPFETASFDVVVSHTFLNCVEDAKRAMEEMKRVVRRGGTITSVTSMSLGFETWYKGDYPKECRWNEVIEEASLIIYRALRKNGLSCTNRNRGVATSYMPVFFTKAGLQNIQVMPLARAFSLSNFALAKEDKKEYILNMYNAECDRLSMIEKYPEVLQMVGKELFDDYKRAILEKREFWLAHLEDNTIWDWFGSSSLLVSGIVG